MSVTVLLFAQLRERAGGRSAWVRDVAAGARAADVLDELVAEGVLDHALAGRVAVAVNREYVDRTWALREGDELAVLPPVSGGAQ